VTAETGRQPWVVFGVLRTSAGASPAESVPAGTGIFTLLGFMGLYLFVGILYLVLILRLVAQGPDETPAPAAPAAVTGGPAEGVA
jgi:cytochrome d ubiquinol oxidase subunit I